MPLSFVRLAIGWWILVPLSVLVHELGHFLPVWIAGCSVELRFALIPHVVWPVCSTEVDALARAGGPLASLLLPVVGACVQAKWRQAGVLLSELGLFLPVTAALSLLLGFAHGHWLATAALAVAGLALAALSLLREPDRRPVVLALVVGMPAGTLSWCLAGWLLSGVVL